MPNRVIAITDSLVEPPAPAVTVEYARRHLRSLGTSEDVLIAGWIAAATSYFQEQTGRQVMRATREAWLDAFPGQAGAAAPDRRIALPFPPLVAVLAVEYVDASGAVLSHAEGSPEVPLYSVRAPQGDYAAPGTVEPLAGGSWPTTGASSDAVRIRYTCGYAEVPDDVPDLIKAIILFLVAHFDQHRGAVHAGGGVTELPYGVKAMLDGFKYSSLTDVVLYRGDSPFGGAAWAATP